MGFLLLIGLWGCQPSKNPQPTPEVILTFINEGAENWILKDVQGATDIGTIGAKDTALTLSVNTRYTIVNKGGLGHPFQLLNGNTVLLSELGGGSFEDDSEVNFTKGNSSISFTLTQALADVLDTYNCAFHLDMSGKISNK